MPMAMAECTHARLPRPCFPDTGPMFMKYNTALRACGNDSRFKEKFIEICHGNR